MRAHSSIGWIVPTSLFACMMLTRIVRGVIARRRSSGSTRPEPIDRQIGHRAAQSFEKPAGFDDRRMLDRRGDDVIALVAKREERALEGEVVGLAAAAGEDDLVAVAAEQCRHLAACLRGRPSPACRPVPLDGLPNDPRETAASRRRPPDRSACWRCSRDRCVMHDVEHQDLVSSQHGRRRQFVHGAAPRCLPCRAALVETARVHAVPHSNAFRHCRQVTRLSMPFDDCSSHPVVFWPAFGCVATASAIRKTVSSVCDRPSSDSALR